MSILKNRRAHFKKDHDEEYFYNESVVFNHLIENNYRIHFHPENSIFERSRQELHITNQRFPGFKGIEL